MKTVVLLPLLVAAFAAHDYDKQCKQMPDHGPCTRFLTMWWFNAETQSCGEFFYGGCMGNENRYRTKEDCEQMCLPARVPVNPNLERGEVVPLKLEAGIHNFACFERPDPGTCNAYIPRYNFDNVTGTCKEFVYGGCGGNWNNYETLQECMASCAPRTDYERKCLARAEKGPCRAGIPMWAYYSTEGQCKQFLYGGCDGNDNKYLTKEECESTCLSTLDTPTVTSLGVTEEFPYSFVRLTSSSVCTLEKDPGPCNMFTPHFYYNPVSATCEVFTYGGCKGNGNNFMSLTECLETCSTEYAALPRA